MSLITAGGVAFEAMNEHGMLRTLPGVFCAGEMLDWEAPTGGYLLTACLASGRAAALAALAWCADLPAQAQAQAQESQHAHHDGAQNAAAPEVVANGGECSPGAGVA